MTRNHSNGSSNKPARANNLKKQKAFLWGNSLFTGRLIASTLLAALSIMSLSGNDWQLGLQLQAQQWDAALKIDLKSQSNR